VRHIILDCDPGHDDAFALALAQTSPEIELLGITVTYGNTSLEHTYRNAKALARVLSSKAPVLSGSSEPLLRPRISGESAHGPSGLEGPTLPQAQPITGLRQAVPFIIEQALKHSTVTLVAVGPLTNIALALRTEPAIIPHIQEIALMGGSTGRGNITPVAEFNIFADPHAAQVVLQSGIPITLFGLNVTEHALLYQADLDQLKHNPSQASSFLAAVLDFFLKAHLGWGFAGACMHDPCPVAYLLQPELFELKPMRVEVDTGGGIGFGQTVCDPNSQNPNARVAVGADYGGLRRLMMEHIATL
jgi:inosine-uridine nucleoside N-ribohydrolase